MHSSNTLSHTFVCAAAVCSTCAQQHRPLHQQFKTVLRVCAISSCASYHLPDVLASTVVVIAAAFGTGPLHPDILPILAVLVLCMCACACRALVSPVVKGAENLPDPLGPRRPLLFIGTLHPSRSEMLSSYSTELADILRGHVEQDSLSCM